MSTLPNFRSAALTPGYTAAAPDYLVSRWLFLRLLGIVYLAAFLSLWVQIHGLVGSRGVLPIREFLSAVHDAVGSQQYYLAPTLCWLDSSDAFLTGLCAAGAIFACLLIVGVAPLPVLVALWALYLSLVVAGQEFLQYQWDGLLLETGLLAVFYAPPQLWPRLATEAPPPRLAIWLLRWLLFRLMFGSGIVKLLSGDPTWRDLTALHNHYETQPLPTWTSWYAHQFPGWFQRGSVLLTFLAELGAPFLMLGPRRARYVAVGLFAGLQLLIAATGNYGFFNLLTLALCMPLLDDDVFPRRWRTRVGLDGDAAAPPRRLGWPPWLLLPLAACLVFLSMLVFLASAGVIAREPGTLAQMTRIAASFRSVNAYGLFAVMTTRRPEIIIEGSDDGVTWRAYEFRWKPGRMDRAPRFTGLHLPRLDWQMWFAAPEAPRSPAWLQRFLARLREGSPDVLDLLEHNPFPDAPPRLVRAVLYDYHFTTPLERRETGAWWRRH